MMRASNPVVPGDLLRSAAGLQAAGRLGEAEALYRSVLQMHPGNAAVQHMLGVCLLQGGQADRAVKVLAAAVRQRPGEAALRLSLAEAQRAVGQREAALVNFERAAALSDDNAHALMASGMLLEEIGQYADALRRYERVLDADPGHVQALVGRANALLLGGQLESALAAFDLALTRSPGHRLAATNRGVALTRLGRAKEAVGALDEVLAAHPGDIHALVNRGNALYALDRFEESLASHRRALEQQAGFIPAMIGQAVSLFELRRYAEAIDVLDRVLLHDPQHADAHVYRGMAHLVQGHFAAGWADYEWRPAGCAAAVARGEPLGLAVRTAGARPGKARIARLPAPAAGKPLADLRGRSVLLTHEQGHGDTVHFVRYAAALKARGARVVLRAQAALTELLRSLEAADVVLAQDEPVPMADFHCPMMSLPYALGEAMDTGAAAVPYLAAPAERLALWRSRLQGDDGRPRIGVAWSGSRHNVNDRRRSLALEQFVQLSRPWLRLISLQPEAGGTVAPHGGGALPVEQYCPQIRDFADTAAMIACCDLVISVDTAAAHIAGAMGKPVWILLPFAPDWRWGEAGDATAWYPTARLFRQRSIGDWDGVLAEVQTALEARFAPAQPAPLNGQGRLTDARQRLERGDPQGAIQCCREILRADPASFEAHVILGAALRRAGDARGALAALDAAAGLRAGSAEVCLLRGDALADLGQIGAAGDAFAHAARLAPQDPALLTALGMRHHALGQIDKALDAADRVVALAPGAAVAWGNRAMSLDALRRPAEALASYERALALAPGSADLHLGRAKALCDLARYAEALEALEQILRSDPRNREALDRRARALRGLGRLAEAHAASDEALRVDPASASSWAQRGCTRALQCRHQEALADLDRAVQLAPGDCTARLNRGLVRLVMGDFRDGWDDYEFRDDARLLARELPGAIPLWTKGQDLAGKTLVLHGEQGAGDTLQFCRFAPLLAEKCAAVHLIVPAALQAIVASIGGGVHVHARDGRMPKADLQCGLLSVAHRLALDLPAIPARIPYLRAPGAQVSAWRHALANDTAGRGPGAPLRLGLACSGNAANSNDAQRSIGLAMLAPLVERLREAGAQWHLLQTEVRAADEPWLERLGIQDHRARLTDFAQTAALAQCMDAVVSVDTAVAHLAGALGIPLYLLLPVCPDWRWLLAREDTPWYPGARLFRQTRAGDWSQTIDRLTDALTVHAPRALGAAQRAPITP